MISIASSALVSCAGLSAAHSTSSGLFVNDIIALGSIGFTSAFSPLIEQDGKYYTAYIPGIFFPSGTPAGSTGYQTISQSGLVAADFAGYDPSTGMTIPGEPNFAGDPMLFGLLVGASLIITEPFTVIADYDNLTFDISTASTVPEPSSLLLIASALAGLGGFALAVDRRERGYPRSKLPERFGC